MHNLTYTLLVAVVIQLFPLHYSSANELSNNQCLLDGFISSSYNSVDQVTLDSADQPLVLNFLLQNGSEKYSFGSVQVGVGLYENEFSTTPIFWSPVFFDITITPNANQPVEAIVDAFVVPAGTYVARLGVAQGDQLAAMDASQRTSPIEVEVIKSDAEETYPVELLTSTEAETTGDTIGYEFTVENQTGIVQRDYTQNIALYRGASPLGSALISQIATPVKMIPDSSEKTSLNKVITTDGAYTALAFSTKENTFLPVVTDQFTVGEESGPVDTFIAATGVDHNDQDSNVVEIVSCAASVNGDSFDTVQIEHQIVGGDIVVFADVAEIDDNSSLVSRVAKDGLSDFSVVSTLYTNLSASSSDEIGAQERVSGSLQQSVTQHFVCDEDCQVPTLVETVEAFASEDIVQSMFWFYLGIVLAAVLVLFLLLRRLTPEQEQDEYEEMHKPQ